MYQCSEKLGTCKEHCCFDHSDFPAHSMFTSDVCWGGLGTSIFGNSSSAASNTRSRLPFRLSFRFLWLCRSINFLKSTNWKYLVAGSQYKFEKSPRFVIYTGKWTLGVAPLFTCSSRCHNRNVTTMCHSCLKINGDTKTTLFR